jgi:sugar porter (SP) family MFS transporter
MIIPLYQSELAHPSIRGRISATVQFMLGIGALAAAWISYGVDISFAADDDGQWRTSLGIQVIPAVFLAALIMVFPESPRWLISKGKVEQGLKNLAKLHSNGDENDVWVQAEFQQIQEALAYEKENAAQSYLELFKDKSCFRRLFLACALQASVQMTGVSAIQYYSVTIYEKMGIDGTEALKYQAISSILALCGQALCIAFIDRFGRRWPLILGNLTNCLMFIIATIMLAVFPPGQNGNKGASWGFIIVTWAYNFSFSSTCGPLSWIIPAEIFDTKTRSKGVSIATMVSFAFNTMIGQVTKPGMETAGWRFYLLFVVRIPYTSPSHLVNIHLPKLQICNLTNAIFFYCFLPETAKRPLEEMNYLFTNAPIFVPGMDKRDFPTDIERRVEEVEAKQGSISHAEEVKY